MNRAQISEREIAAEESLEELMKEQEVAGPCKVSVASLRRWRLVGGGPPFVKLGSAVRYRKRDVVRWLESRLKV